VLVPGATLSPEQRFHSLEPPYLFSGAQVLLSKQARDYVRDYRFAIAPARDDRPYFGHYFRWRSLPELWRLREQGSAVLLDSGYLLLVAALLQAVPLTLLLVLLPLRALSSHRLRKSATQQNGASGIAVARPCRRLLSRAGAGVPADRDRHARAAHAAGRAPFAGGWVWGSAVSCCALVRAACMRSDGCRARMRIATAPSWSASAGRRAPLPSDCSGSSWRSHLAYTYGAGWPVWTRALLGLLGIAPLAFAMGVPFALGLSRLARIAPAFVPWAWGLNGCASVVAAILAVLLSMAFGLRATLLIALALYAFAAWIWPARESPEARQD
jgi:hypothetical protein